MSAESSGSNSEQKLTSQSPNRLSTDGSANLNDDLANGSEYSSSSFVSLPNHNLHRRSGSAVSFKNSVDADSSFLSSAYFQILNNHNSQDDGKINDIFSPLGPNSIYELTIASDSSRAKKSRTPKNTVTINGGITTVSNLRNPTLKDIPQIQLLKLKQKVENKELESSLIHVSEEDYKNFELSYKLLTEDTLQKFIELDNNRQGNLSASSSISNFPTKNNYVSYGDDEISSIPKVFLDSNFRLDDPRIFKQVIGDFNLFSDNETPDENAKSSLANNHDLQEELSHYLDIVEVNLIKEISKSSDSFFNTIGDIKEIQSQSESCAVQFHGILDKLQLLEEKECQRGLDILNKVNERKNVEHLESSLLQLKYLVSIIDLAKISFDNGNHSKCLNEIVVAEHLMTGIELEDPDEDKLVLYPDLPYAALDLSNLSAISNLKSDIQDLKQECSKGYISAFIDLLLEDLRQHYNNVPYEDTLNRMATFIDKSKKHGTKSLNKSYQSISEDKKEKFKEYITNLAKSGHLSQSYANYQDRLITEIKDIIKVNLPSTGKLGVSLADMSNVPSRSSSVPPESNNNLLQPGSGVSGNSLSSNIRCMTPKEFETMLTKIYTSLSECLRRLTVQQKILLDFALTAIPPNSEDNLDVMSLDITFAINKSIELTQIRLTKIINVRLEQTAEASLDHYLRLYALSSAYLQECELINPGYVASGAGNSLNDWVKNHIGYFIHKFHLNSLAMLANNCDKEVWREITQEDVLQEHQVLIDEICGYAEYIETDGKSGFSGDSWMSVLDLHETAKEDKENSSKSSKPLDGRLIIHNESFMIPELTLKSLVTVREYLIISKVFSNKSSVIENNLLNYFKLMNSKTSQAVLNAGATRTAGLKHITTKHIALCIQLVEFNIALLSSLQGISKQMRNLSPPPNSHEEISFARILSNYKDHENELFSKLVSIMYDRTINHCATIVTINLSEPLKHPQQCHLYMETLVKETTTVTKVLTKYLPEIKCSLILLQIFDNYKKLLVDCFCTQLSQFKDFNEKHSLLKDIDYFRVKLSEIPGYGNSGQVIWENVNSLPTIEDTKMEQVMRNNIEGERQQNTSTQASQRNSSEIDNEPDDVTDQNNNKNSDEKEDSQVKK
ncbi:uncharacterized protein AC631_05214 [Debaryomyces fabryi]|uniref:Vacuolar protein sorting-associated protein 54 C-terminal domain-containing protein n=1 Tax=Debaryomyces fabryi TaxID=58627 RepID=A0A0V1PSA4_9ASCO|nr:uncharacterized protein AC631_05214 [Debaryomyces fabryi]KRZ99026.1 hypothetical protein AC631_05214 [Debaryomyces fabryi]CUM57052.1 unnamed protein product [Debaryomyces fabryi]